MQKLSSLKYTTRVNIFTLVLYVNIDFNLFSLFFICLGPCAKYPACILLGLECQYVLMRNHRDFMVNFEPGQYIQFKHISPRCRAFKPNLHHSPLRGKTIILQMTLYVSIHSCICPVSQIKEMAYDQTVFLQFAGPRCRPSFK